MVTVTEDGDGRHTGHVYRTVETSTSVSDKWTEREGLPPETLRCRTRNNSCRGPDFTCELCINNERKGGERQNNRDWCSRCQRRGVYTGVVGVRVTRGKKRESTRGKVRIFPQSLSTILYREVL